MLPEFPWWLSGKNLPALQQSQEMWVLSLGWEDLWRRIWQPTPVSLPGESHRQSRVVGYSPWGRKELYTTEATEHTHTHAVRFLFVVVVAVVVLAMPCSMCNLSSPN